MAFPASLVTSIPFGENASSFSGPGSRMELMVVIMRFASARSEAWAPVVLIRTSRESTLSWGKIEMLSIKYGNLNKTRCPLSLADGARVHAGDPLTLFSKNSRASGGDYKCELRPISMMVEIKWK